MTINELRKLISLLNDLSKQPQTKIMELKILDSLSVAVSELKEVTSEIKKIRTGLNVLYQKGDKVTFGNREAIVILCDGNFADIEFIGSNTIYEGVDISFLEPN